MKLILALLAPLLAAACAPADRYPVSGTECAPDDPVLDMRVPDCPPS